jgi:hypothetical protein
VSDVLHWSFDDGQFPYIFSKGYSNSADTLLGEDFDPNGDWTNTYNFFYTQAIQRRTVFLDVHYGKLRICRKVREDGKVVFDVEVQKQTGQHVAHEVQVTKADFVCNIDELSTLAIGETWRLSSEVTLLRNEALKPYSRYEEWGRLGEDGSDVVIEKSKDGSSFMEFARQAADIPVSANWALFDAVQRLAPEKISGGPIRFTMLNHLDKVQGDQRLSFLEKFDAKFGQRQVSLRGFCQVGSGVMPMYYWVDERGRLVVARFGLLGLVLTDTWPWNREGEY